MLRVLWYGTDFKCDDDENRRADIRFNEKVCFVSSLSTANIQGKILWNHADKPFTIPWDLYCVTHVHCQVIVMTNIFQVSLSNTLHCTMAWVYHSTALRELQKEHHHPKEDKTLFCQEIISTNTS